MDKPIAYMFLSEKREYNRDDECEVHGCKNKTSWIVPVRAHLIGNEKKLCSSCVDKMSQEADDDGRVGLRLPPDSATPRG